MPFRGREKWAPNVPAALRREPVVVGVLEVELAGLVVAVLCRQLVMELVQAERLELLRSVMEAPSESLRGLAERLDRAQRGPRRRSSPQGLRNHRSRDRRARKAASVPYQTIEIEVTLSLPDDATAMA